MSELERHIWIAAYGAAFVDLSRHDDTENGMAREYIAVCARSLADAAVLGFRALQAKDPSASIEAKR